MPEDANIGKSMGREENERVIAQLLYDGYLQFDFSYTAYATNAYLKASQRASLILQGKRIASSLRKFVPAVLPFERDRCCKYQWDIPLNCEVWYLTNAHRCSTSLLHRA